jgi:hypothetical protein
VHRSPLSLGTHIVNARRPHSVPGSLPRRVISLASNVSHLDYHAKTYDVSPGGGGGAGCEGILGAGVIGLGLNAFKNPNICYSA